MKSNKKLATVIPNFVLSYFIQKNAIHVKNKKILINNKTIPLNDGNLLLKYSSQKEPFPVFSFLELLSASTLKDKNKKDFFKGKTVFIGLTAAGLFDLKPTPVSSKTPGLFIHATAFENLLNNNFIKKEPLPSTWHRIFQNPSSARKQNSKH